MKKLLSIAALVVVGLLSPIVAQPIPAEAGVPGLRFTNTFCPERSDAVARLYTAAFDREPERSGFNFWFDAYTDGRHSLPSMAEFFVNSPELIATYGSLDDEQFIDRLYRNVLDRPADGGGRAFWLNEIDNGATRATILLRFSESPENVTKSGTTVPELGYYNSGIVGPWKCVGLTDCGVASPPPLIAGDCNFPAPIIALSIRNQNIDDLIFTPVLAGDTFDRSDIDETIADLRVLRDDVDFVVFKGTVDVNGDVIDTTECFQGEDCRYLLADHDGRAIVEVKVVAADTGVIELDIVAVL